MDEEEQTAFLCSRVCVSDVILQSSIGTRYIEETGASEKILVLNEGRFIRFCCLEHDNTTKEECLQGKGGWMMCDKQILYAAALPIPGLNVLPLLVYTSDHRISLMAWDDQNSCSDVVNEGTGLGETGQDLKFSPIFKLDSQSSMFTAAVAFHVGSSWLCCLKIQASKDGNGGLENASLKASTTNLGRQSFQDNQGKAFYSCT